MGVSVLPIDVDPGHYPAIGTPGRDDLPVWLVVDRVMVGLRLESVYI